MTGFTFNPRLETLNDRLCMSAVTGDLMAVDVPKSGDEVGLIGLLRQGDEKGLLPAIKVADMDFKTGEMGWDVKPGEDRVLLPAVQVVGGLDYKTGDMGWDVKPGEDRGLLPAIKVGDAGSEKGAAVDFGLLLPAIKVGDAGGEHGIVAVENVGGTSQKP